jgi:hypothetical protein
MRFTITVSHDEKEGVWYVQESDMPGLNAESPTLDALIEVIADLAPGLLAANMPEAFRESTAPVSLCVQHLVSARSAHAA